jgi:uncharacterized membrane protein YGL010W
MAIKNAFNLEKQFTFYASYHRQPVNVAIHLLCIWPILSTAILMLQVTVVQSSYFVFKHVLPFYTPRE